MEDNRHIPDIEYTVALLQYVRTNAEIRPFLKASDNDLKRLNNKIEALIRDGVVVRNESGLELTEKGDDFFWFLNKKMGRKGLYAFVLPDYSVRKKPMKKSDLYVPQYMSKGGEGHFSESYIYLE